MKKLSIQALGLSNNELLTREQLKNVLGGEDGYGSGGCQSDSDCGNGYCMITGCVANTGGPGGNNGNPCPTYCEPMGGSIVCVGTRDGIGYYYPGNCNLRTDTQGLHNRCINEATGNFWC